MSDLSGNLAAFGLPGVFDLLGGAGKSGELRLNVDGVTGRIILNDGAIAYATHGTDALGELARLHDMYRSGLDRDDAGPATVEEAIDERVIEVCFQLMQRPNGTFEFSAAPGPADLSYGVHVADVLRRVEERSAEWEALRTVIPTDDTVFRLARRLPGQEPVMTIDALTWRLLALVGDGGSVAFLADELGLSEFRSARLLADLFQSGLLERSEGEAPSAFVASSHQRSVPDATPLAGMGAEQDSAAADGAGTVEVFGPAEPSHGQLALDEPAALQLADEPTDELFDELLLEDSFIDEFEEDEPPTTQEVPQLAPPTPPVSFSKSDLSPAERDELIRNIGRGIFPS